MIRIFIPLAVLATILLVGNLIFGLWFGDLNTPVSECRTIGEEILDLSQLYPMPTAKIAELEQRKKSLFDELGSVQERSTVHIMLGVLAALMTALVSSIAITYHIGTSRWCREVVETYALDAQLVHQSNRIKRGTFPWALTGILAIVGVIALGAASDPATGIDLALTRTFRQIHLLSALMGFAFIGLTYYMAWTRIGTNQHLVQRVLDEVQRIRRERGLD